MYDNDDHKSTREISDTDRGNHKSEVPMPQQKTGDVQSPPSQGQHLSDGMSDENTPSHPESDRA